MEQKQVILLAEDNRDHAYYLQLALDEARIPHDLYVVANGNEAIRYLSAEGKYENRQIYPYPDLFLLDLKMPGMSGFDVLSWLKEREEHRALAKVVLTVSEEIKDVNYAYQLGAKSFLIKPTSIRGLRGLADDIREILAQPRTNRRSSPARPSHRTIG